MAKGKSWDRDELIVVFNLYCSVPFGQMHARNPVVIDMARALGRTVGSVAMKLVNFASFDPAHRARGVKGLTAASRADRLVWDEFHGDWDHLAYESEKRFQKLLVGQRFTQPPATAAKPARVFKMPSTVPEGPSESMKTTRVRMIQGFFRKAVLAAYQGRCCLTGNPVPQLLVASHI